MDKTAIRDAATTIVLRDTPKGKSVLMGQRGKTAAFMPGKFVFPGGAVDPNDANTPLHGLQSDVAQALTIDSRISARAIMSAAIRELWEETGMILGHPAPWPDAPYGWRGFAATGHVPTGHGAEFVFRAVTPTGRPRRFDARFILVDAQHIVTDLDDFSRAEDELSQLQWVPLHKARSFDLPFITQVVLAELMSDQPSEGIPFFRNDDEDRLVARIGGASVL